jgi:hypothetical protein
LRNLCYIKNDTKRQTQESAAVYLEQKEQAIFVCGLKESRAWLYFLWRKKIFHPHPKEVWAKVFQKGW